jgi:hypothetical protein
MNQNLSKGTRMTVLAVVLIAALLMIAVLPLTVPDALELIQVEQAKRIAKFYADNNPDASLISKTRELVGFFFPLWTSLTMFAGMVLLVIAKPFYQGAKWARSLALACLSIPSIGGAYMTVPYLNFAKVGTPNGLWFAAVGLIAYFVVVLATKASAKAKLIDFWVFLIMGVTAAEAFSNGHAASRIVSGHFARPHYADGIFILFPTMAIGWIATILLLLAIYFVAQRHIAGWYLALMSGLGVMIMGFVTQTVRTATFDYLYQGLMGLAILATFLIPVVKARMIEKE